MLVVTVTLHNAWGGHPEEIAKLFISNDGKGNPQIANYEGYIPPDIKPKERPEWMIFKRKSAKVVGYPRQDLHVWSLVHKMLGQMCF